MPNVLMNASKTNAGALSAVKAHWEAEPCGTGDLDSQAARVEYFRSHRERRERMEPYLAEFAQFAQADRKRVLEIGVGVGSDYVRWVAAGGKAVGIDLTHRAVRETKSHSRTLALDARLANANAEELPFASASFDLVWSWGVLHHTPEPKAAFAEILRVLRPGGELRAMLYHSRSWVSLALWLRHGLLRGAPFRPMDEILSKHLESPGTKAYTPSQIPDLLRGFDSIESRTVLTPYDLLDFRLRESHGAAAGIAAKHFWPRPLIRLTGDSFGWNLLVRARRPAA